MDPANVPTVESCWVSSDFFRTLGISLLQGRSFSDHDDERGAPVVIINKALAERYWPRENPIGRRLSAQYVGSGRSGDSTATFREIVGVVADVRQKALDSPADPAVYMPYMQDPTHHVFSGLHLFLWTQGEPAAFSDTVRNQIHTIAPNQPIDVMETMEDSLFQTLARRRFVLTLISSFAGLALFLSAIGIYGMIAYSVGQRITEMGLRLALGSSRAAIVRQIVSETLVLTIVGLAIGCVLAGILSEMMKSLLFGIRAADGVTFLGSALVLISTAVLASLLPAIRAASIDPMLILRAE
jgi:predicted permease